VISIALGDYYSTSAPLGKKFAGGRKNPRLISQVEVDGLRLSQSWRVSYMYCPQVQNLLIALSLSAGGLCAVTLPKGVASSDWSSITKEYQRRRHGAFPIDGGYRTRSWEQQFVTRFDGRRFEVIPDEGRWRWGLRLESYGFRGGELNVAERAQVSTDVERISYRWDARVEEWFINSERGLEHGFTISSRPHGAGPLLLHLAVRGSLHGEGSGTGIRFTDASGVERITYAGLTVTDAVGRKLSGRMAMHAGGLRIEVDEIGARYPITIDPLVQQAYLKASNNRAYLGFGWEAVAIDGDTVVVGDPGEPSKATGVNGDQSDTSAVDAGAAYVFVRSGTTWTQQAYLKAINTQAGAWFGNAVAVSGDSIVVGALNQGQITQGVNPPATPVVPNPAPFSGAAYTFIRIGSAWISESYIKASNTRDIVGIGANFGNSVAISGDTMAIGAPHEDNSAVGINNNQKLGVQTFSGAVYLYGRVAGLWTQQAYVKGPVNKAQLFGSSVAVSGNTVVVGAPFENSGSSGTAGDPLSTSSPQSGAAYVYLDTGGGQWVLQQYLKASNNDANDQFGSAVAISGDTLAVTAVNESSNATGVNGNQFDNSASQSGAVYLFQRAGAAWGQQAYIKASNTGTGDMFGTSVAISGDMLVVGAPHEHEDNLGAAYTFVRNGTAWSQDTLLKASNSTVTGTFGNAVSVSNGTVIAGGLDNSNATGVNGDESNTLAMNSGAAYIFVTPAPPPPVIPPDLELTLQHLASFTAGSPGQYQIVVSNQLVQFNGTIGPTTATITVTDPMVPGITLQPASIVAAQWDCSTSTTLLLQCTTDQILAPQASSSNIDFTVDVTAAGGYLITNVATVSGGGETSAQTSNDTWPDQAIVAGVPAPDLTIVSTHTANLTQGGTGTFFLTVANSGPAAWGNYVAVADSLPAGVSATAISGPGWTCSLAGIPGVGMGCTRQDALAAGASYPVITIAVNVATDAPASSSNTGRILTNGLENQANDTFFDPVTIIIPAPFDLGVTLTHSGNFAPGGTVTFTARVTNVGAGPFPPSPGFNLIASSISTPLISLSGVGWTCSPAGQPPYCTRADGLPAGASFPAVTFTMQIPANATGSFGLGVEVTSYPRDPNATNNMAIDSAPIIQPLPPDMTATITHSGNFVPGATVTFIVTVKNVGTGPLPASLGYDFVVLPSLPLLSMSGPGWACQVALNSSSCNRPDGLSAGDSFPDVTVTMLIPANATGSIDLEVLVLHVPNDPNANNDHASDTVPIVLLPVPTLTWSNPADILAGTPLGSAQLNATASVPGAFLYNPAPGTLLQVGSGQMLSVVFTPTDTNTYASAHATVAINVLPVPGAPVKIITTSVLNRTVGNDLSVHLTFANIGGTAAANVVLTGVKIGSTLGTSLPQIIGAIASNGSTTASVTIPGSAGAAGSPNLLTVTGTYSGGTFSATTRITLP
jgi:uncharacterized repeat protein (TIGR01451 family)